MRPSRARRRDPHAHAVVRPGPRLLAFAPFAWMRGRRDRSRAPTPSLAMVPLVDCLVVVVAFLLHSFQASAE